ncbi:Uncharacterised protein [Mycobacteroides abscessus subsp. abscessus]|nr:Uncharacterised protein [Mycobacteroides abscessus subsp. abscessus]
MPMRRSIRSTRLSTASRLRTEAGRRMRAAMSSSCSLGEVAPDISVSPWLRMSAARESSA